ncbi:hypothetical protein AAFG13_35730 [Bradyrhizobium sp. B124]|uniref:hypothetical protein n=1 Tax=Bradyrhizobium sp. B124 TaxID=3140245 RepID=UPI0031836D93
MTLSRSLLSFDHQPSKGTTSSNMSCLPPLVLQIAMLIARIPGAAAETAASSLRMSAGWRRPPGPPKVVSRTSMRFAEIAVGIARHQARIDREPLVLGEACDHAAIQAATMRSKI